MRIEHAVGLSLAALVVTFGCATGNHSTPQFGPERRNPNVVAHLRHADLHFSVSVEARQKEPSFLEVSFPVKQSGEGSSRTRRPEVRARVTLADHPTVFEGVMEEVRWGISNGGWSTDRYRLPLRPELAIGHIHSVTIWIGTDEYEFHPF